MGPTTVGARGLVSVLVVDDQASVRDGLLFLVGLLPGVRAVGSAADGGAALREIARLDPDVVLLDLDLPVLDGVEVTRQLVASGSRTRVIALTTYSGDDWVFAALGAGARGFLTKDAAAEDIRRAIEAVAAGHAQLTPSVQRRLLERLAAQERAGVQVGAPAEPGPSQEPAPHTAPRVKLTPREREMLALVADGLSNAEISARLVLSEATVKSHVNHLLAKTGGRTRAQLVVYAYRNGLLFDEQR